MSNVDVPLRTRAVASRGALADRIRTVLAPLVLAICLIFGGYGPHSPIATAVCLLAALLLLVFELVAWKPLGSPLRWAALGILLAAVALPLLQLVPLPAAIWQALPGRGLVLDTLAAAGLPTDGSQPLTFDTLATLEAALHLIPTLALFFAASRLDEAGRMRLLGVILGVACLALVGALLPVNSRFILPNNLTVAPIRFAGFFANANHQADFMLVGLVCAASLFALLARRGFAYLVSLPFLACAMALGVLGAGSRMGLVLLPPVFLASLVLVWRQLSVQREERRVWLVAFGVFVALSLLAASLYLLPSLVRATVSQDIEDPRMRSLPDILWAVGNYFPAGTGMGTFDQIFRSAERIDQLSNIYMNEAHNEYLQVLLEGGIAGAVILAAGVIWYLIASIAAWRRQAALAQAGSIVLAIYLAHSTVDYPLRTIAHSAIIGLFIALLSARLVRTRVRTSQRRGRSGQSRRSDPGRSATPG